MIKYLLLFSIILSSVSAQKWKRSEPTEVKFTLFKSPRSYNLETAEVVPKGDLFYAIAHRFKSPVSTGFSDFYGLDGGAQMRTELGYGITDNFMATLGRAGQNGQFDLNLKYKIWQSKEALPLPIMISVNAGGAYSTKDLNSNIENGRKYQFFGSAIINTMLFDRLAIGVTPTYLHNSLVSSVETQYSLTLGYYIQYYLGDDMTSFIIEANPTISGFRGNGEAEFYDTYSFGVEFETGGHFFKLLLSNNTLMNNAQFNLGSQRAFSLDNLVFGFQITRNFGLLN